jgi:hypothetical protein
LHPQDDEVVAFPPIEDLATLSSGILTIIPGEV